MDEIFKVGDLVDVAGQSIGKGFAGEAQAVLAPTLWFSGRIVAVPDGGCLQAQSSGGTCGEVR